nr:RNA-directed DNA polymerase, eukaryota [Tanacetum cinerariifolium]
MKVGAFETVDGSLKGAYDEESTGKALRLLPGAIFSSCGLSLGLDPLSFLVGGSSPSLGSSLGLICWRLVCLPRVYDDVGCLLALVLFHALPLSISFMHTYTGRRSPGSSLFTFGFILEVGVGSVYISPPPYPAPAGLVAKYQRQKSIDNNSILSQQNRIPKTTLSAFTNKPTGKPSFASVVYGSNSLGDSPKTRSISLKERDLVSIDDSSRVSLVKLKEVDTMSNMFKICRNIGLRELENPSRRWEIFDVHIQEIDTWSINIIDESLESQSMEDENKESKPKIPVDLNPDYDLEELLDYLNENKGHNVVFSEDTNIPNNEKINIQNVEESQKAQYQSPKVTSSHDLSCPPSFEDCKKELSSNSNCSTSFAKYRKNDTKVFSLINEMTRILNIGS